LISVRSPSVRYFLQVKSTNFDQGILSCPCPPRDVVSPPAEARQRIGKGCAMELFEEEDEGDQKTLEISRGEWGNNAAFQSINMGRACYHEQKLYKQSQSVLVLVRALDAFMQVHPQCISV
jgi:hypothetical protein